MTMSYAAAASVARNDPGSSAYSTLCHSLYQPSEQKLASRFSSYPNLLRLSKDLRSSCNNRSVIVRAELNEESFSQWFSPENLVSSFRSLVETVLRPFAASEVGGDGSFPTASEVTSPVESLALPAEPEKNGNLPDGRSPPALSSEESVSEFMTRVISLVRLVNSRDIVELQLKQLNCELVIRKVEALPPSLSSHPPYMPHHVQSVASTAPPSAPTPASPVLAPAPTVSPVAPAKSKPSKSSLPPMKCPMAGTFYRCPAPGEPPFVKVGDKVQKGQVLCIIEAMKLMNEIEADQSGTIVEILIEDGKPVSVDTPLLVIQ